MKLITFEERGQDFTRWLVDEKNKGQVVACAPFQHDIWTQGRVGNLDDLHIGEQVLWHRLGDKPMFIKYPVVKFEDCTTAAQLLREHGVKLVGQFVLTVRMGGYPGGITRVRPIRKNQKPGIAFHVQWEDSPRVGFPVAAHEPVHYIGRP